MLTVYVLRSRTTGKLYVGQTQDLEKRLAEHHAGIARYSRNRGPWELVYTEPATSRSDAMLREKALKSGQGRAWLKARIKAKPPGC